MIFPRVIFYKVWEMAIDAFLGGIIKNFEKHTGRRMFLSEAKVGDEFLKIECYNDIAHTVLVESIDNIGFTILYKYSEFLEKDGRAFIWVRSCAIPENIIIDISNYLESKYSKEYVKETMFFSSTQFILTKELFDDLRLIEFIGRNIKTKITYFEAAQTVRYF